MRKFMIVFLICFVCLGCSRVESGEVGQDVLVDNSNDDFVMLSDVQTPLFNESFATISIDNWCTVVKWGTSDDGDSYSVKDSGYPGFGFPILVVSCDASTGSAIGTEVRVNTMYGIFYYKVDSVYSARLNDSGRNVIDCDTGLEIINWGRSQEVLVIYFSDGTAILASLTHGTEIVPDV